MKTFHRTRIVAAAALLFAGAISACDDSTSPEPEPDIARMRLTVGQQVVNIDEEGVCTGCPLVVTNGSTIVAEFLRENGLPDPVVAGGGFRLNVVIPQNAAGLTFALSQTNPFGGTFTATGTAATPFNVTFEAFHIEEGHEDFGHAVSVRVQ